MADIASLGLSIDSKPIEQATQALNKFATSGKQAETAAKGVEASVAKVGVAASGMSRQMQQAVNSAAQINQRLNVRDGFGGASKAADIAAYGQEMDNLRARFNPLFAAERTHKNLLDEINKAAKVGAISEKERAEAVRLAEASYARSTQTIKATTNAIAGTGKQAALSSYALTNLSFQLNDVVTLAALGADPFRILATQAGQFYQILQQGEGGVRGSLGYLKDLLLGLITPLRLVAAGFTAIGVTSALALRSAVADLNEANIALSGVGRSSDLVAADISALAISAAEAGQQSVGGAREIALAAAATGKINKDMIADLIAISRQFGKTFGEDGPEAAARLARAFADPAKGVDEINKRLGAFDDRTKQAILSLTAQNRTLDAQRLMLNGVNSSIISTYDSTSKLERTWKEMTDNVSEYWEKFKQGLARSIEGGTLEDQLKAANEELEKLERWSKRAFKPTQEEVRKTIDTIMELNRAISARDSARAWEAEQEAARRESEIIGDIGRRTIPDYQQLRRATDEWMRLRSAIADNRVMEKLDGFTKIAVLRAEELREHQVEYLNKAVQAGGIALSQAREEHSFAMETIAARNAAQRADIIYRQELTRINREDPWSAEERARMAAKEVTTQAAETARRTAEQRILVADQAIELSRRELNLVGQMEATRSRELSLLQAKQQLESEALRVNGDRNAYDQEHLKVLEDRIRYQERINSLIAEENLKRDLMFERDQMGRSDREQAVFDRLQGAGLLTNGKIIGTQAEMIAQQVRFNEVMKLSQDYSKDFASSLVKDLRDGVDATEALSTAMSRLADRLMDLALDQAFSSAFAPFSSAVAGGATGAAGGLLGGMLIPGVLHDGGVVGSGRYPHRVVPETLFAGVKRYHNGGVIGVNEVPAILEKGETVIPKGKTVGGVTINPVTNVYIEGSADERTIAMLRAELAVRDANLKQQVTNIMQDNLSRGVV